MKTLLTLFIAAAVLRSMSTSTLVLVLVVLVVLLFGIIVGMAFKPAPKKKARRRSNTRRAGTRRPTRPVYR